MKNYTSAEQALMDDFLNKIYAEIQANGITERQFRSVFGHILCALKQGNYSGAFHWYDAPKTIPQIKNLP